MESHGKFSLLLTRKLCMLENLQIHFLELSFMILLPFKPKVWKHTLISAITNMNFYQYYFKTISWILKLVLKTTRTKMKKVRIWNLLSLIMKALFVISLEKDLAQLFRDKLKKICSISITRSWWDIRMNNSKETKKSPIIQDLWSQNRNMNETTERT